MAVYYFDYSSLELIFGYLMCTVQAATSHHIEAVNLQAGHHITVAANLNNKLAYQQKTQQGVSDSTAG